MSNHITSQHQFILKPLALLKYIDTANDTTNGLLVTLITNEMYQCSSIETKDTTLILVNPITIMDETISKAIAEIEE